MCSADILVVFVNFSVRALFLCFSPAKLKNFSSSQNLGATVSTEADKTKLGLYSRSCMAVLL